jgi:hypothetical protein
MPVHLLAELLIELRQRVEEHSRDAQSARSESVEIRARSVQAICQSRELMARVDVLLTLPYVKQRL